MGLPLFKLFHVLLVIGGEIGCDTQQVKQIDRLTVLSDHNQSQPLK